MQSLYIRIMTVREGDEVIYTERVTPQSMMRVEQVIGSWCVW